MLDFFKGVALALVPQPDSGEPRNVYQWRQTAAFCIVLMGLIMGFHIAWACGLLAGFGLVGFATASEVQTVQQQNVALMTDQTDNNIREARLQQCLAIGDGNGRAMIFNDKRLSEQLAKYRAITGQAYERVPDCSELVSAVPSIPIDPLPPVRPPAR